MDQETNLFVSQDHDPSQEETVQDICKNPTDDSPAGKEEDSAKACKDSGEMESGDSISKLIDNISIEEPTDILKSDITAIETLDLPTTSSSSEKIVISPVDTASEAPCTEIDNLSLDAEKSESSEQTENSAITVEALEVPKEITEVPESSRELVSDEKSAEDAVDEKTEKCVELKINIEPEEITNKLGDEVINKETDEAVKETIDEADEAITENTNEITIEETNKTISEEADKAPIKESEKVAEEDPLPSPTEEETSRLTKEIVVSPETISDIADSSLDSVAKKTVDESKPDAEPTSPENETTRKETMLEKQIVEPENTEFVQITQDKQDDSHNESQPIEAEDPFGDGNLINDNAELDSPVDDNINFHKLGDQADNLQDVVNAKDTNFKTHKTKDFVDVAEESNPDDGSETNIESLTGEAADMNVEHTSQSKNKTDAIDTDCIIKTALEKSGIDPMLIDSENDSPKKKKNVDESDPMETEDAQSTVLPGQDDELCIIPDSMKEATAMSSTSLDRTEETRGDAEKESSSSLPVEETSTEKDTEVSSSAMEVCQTNETNVIEKESDVNKDSSAETSAAITDVIDIDDEMKNSEIVDIATKDICKQCNEQKSSNICVKVGTETFNVCSESCKIAFTEENNKAMDIPSDGVNSKREKRCAGCLLIVEAGDERNLSWETMEFCNEECLAKFQTKYGSYCRNCNGAVQPISLGKYCVRFGYDVRQFCCSTCLEDFKKGLKVCSYCQKDISSGTEGFLAPVGDKGQFKDFCTQYCMEKYSKMNSTEPPSVEIKACSVCQEEKVVHCEVQIDRASPVAICSDPCFAAFKFVNKVDPEQCSTCKKFFELATKKSFVVFYESEAHTFCNKTCLNIFIITNRKIVPCNWCKVKKYNFDMIKKDLKTGQSLMMCSLNCLTLYQVSINAVSAKRISCDFCKDYYQAQYHLTMSDATIRNFCSYDCVMKFQGKYTKSPITIPTGDDPVPTGMPKRTYPPAKGVNQPIQKPTEIQAKKTMPVISSVTSLASLTSNGQVTAQTAQTTVMNSASTGPSVATTQSQTPKVIVNQQVITRPPSPVKIHNKITQCKPLTHTKGVSVRPHPCVKSTQTDGDARVLIPIPVPIYVPFPVHMWSMPFPVPIPFPLPIPVPVFIPTTKNSAKSIFKDIKRIQEKIPADPFEAELLMMAEMVATEKKNNDGDSDSSDDNGPEPAEPVDSSNAFGEDMLQMALKMATGELDEPAVDLETALTPNTITATPAPSQPDSAIDADVQPERLITGTRGKKRMVPYKPRSTPSKRGRRISGVHDVPIMPPPEAQQQPRIMEPIEKPDANMALKYTFGVNAWRQWVVAKNTELEKQITPTRKVKLFKTDLLQLTADELNYTLCLFVKEVRKPNGAEYAPDTIYYLCLGIQQYLFENNRIDNIFTDSYYEKFTDCLNEVAKKFSVLYNDAQYIVTRVEEEHLWECKQLGAHSPHVLLSTLMFFNTKHFNLVTVEEHMQLSFSHIMKHWKRNPAAQAAAVAGKGPGTRNVLLRFYPPQSALEANSRKKKVYEQQENEENPLRCPVKLYEFYLSKCPESVKTRNDVFYLLPERSCVPDSPVWYSTSALAKEHLVKMLYRVKMVKEINVALLTS